MDGYPPGSLDHNVPLLVASGLVSAPAPDLGLGAAFDDQAVLIRSDLPPMQGRVAKVLADHLGVVDSRQDAWNGTDTGSGYKFRVITAGRSYLMPRRRAKYPDHVEHPLSQVVLHSPFSPLSPSSPLYPDGIINAQWLRKHQDLVPSLFVPFYMLDPNPDTAPVSDGKLKLDIAGIRTALAKSGYRTKLAIVLIADRDQQQLFPDEGAHERLEGIRKGAGLDPKTVFYVPPPPQESDADVVEAADGILSIMFQQATEYYRDIGRHARKKRGRGSVPPPTVPPTSGTSHTLSTPGWNVRYDFKTAVFAEFRQEMDVALRSYEQCYETLVGPDVLDAIPSWSPRWNEARLVADITAIRCLRCLLWIGMPTTAVRRWQAHRDRIRDLVDRRGRGTSNYGWEAWEARWATVMAQVVERANLAPFAAPILATYILPEKAVLGERIEPWDMLHHTGHWYRVAARHTAARRALAQAIPEEDRQTPDSWPASRVASRAFTYDTYLCPEPHEENGFSHGAVIVHCLMAARSQFEARGQTRSAAELTIQAAGELLRMKAWDEMLAMLRPVWEKTSFRNEGWWLVVEELSWALRKAAVQAGRGDFVLAIDWELLDRKFTLRKGWHYDITRSLEDISTAPEQKVIARTDDSVIRPFVTASFAFASKEGRSGEACAAQLSITSSAHADSAPVTLERLTIEFDKSLWPVVLDHQAAADWSEPRPGSMRHDDVSLARVSLQKEETKGGQGEEAAEEDEDRFRLRGKADLVLVPGRTNVYEVEIVLREPGTVQAVSVALSVQTDAFHLHHSITLEGNRAGEVWHGPQPRQHRMIRPNAHTIEVRPRPAKLQIRHVEAGRQFYTGEAVSVPIELANGELDAIEARLAVAMNGDPRQTFRVECGEMDRTATVGTDGSVINAFSVGRLGPGTTTRALLRLEAVQRRATTYDVTVKVSYHLVSDPETPVIQSLSLRLAIVDPFEASFRLLPRVHADPWPSLFDAGVGPMDGPTDDGSAEENPPAGLSQKWCLHCDYASFAAEDLIITGLDADMVECAGGTARVVAQRPTVPDDGFEIAPRTTNEVQFDIVAQKLSMDDRGPVTINLAFVVRWRRKRRQGDDDNNDDNNDDDAVNTSTIHVPPQPQVVLGTEPRVLATMASTDTRHGPVIWLDVVIENGSGHFLTFGVSMDPSDELAFSGPKQATLHVLPASRRTVSFRLVPLVRGRFVRVPVVVRDKYFQKVLQVLPTEGMRADKEGLLLWVPEGV